MNFNSVFKKEGKNVNHVVVFSALISEEEGTLTFNQVIGYNQQPNIESIQHNVDEIMSEYLANKTDKDPVILKENIKYIILNKEQCEAVYNSLKIRF